MSAAKLIFLTIFLISAPAVTQANALTPDVSHEEPIKIGTSLRIKSAALQQERTINVYLPANYATDSTVRYPVLYVIDGGLKQDFHHISGLANLGGLSGMYPDMIVVGIETLDRKHELTTPTERKDYLRDFPTLGGAKKFRAMIAEEVIPTINSRYRTSAQRIILGESLAAFFITDTFITEPDLFTDYIAITPSMWWDEMTLAKSALTLLSAQQTSTQRSFYLTVADEGGAHRKGNDLLAQAMKKVGAKHVRFVYRPRVNEGHATIYHGAALDALRWLFERAK